MLEKYRDKYYEGVDEAIKVGEVQFGDADYAYGKADPDSHLPRRGDTPGINVAALDIANTGVLAPEARKILDYLIDEAGHNTELKVLVSGAGAGVEASELAAIDKMANERGISIVIDTLSLSPINPQLRFLEQPGDERTLVERISQKVQEVLNGNPDHPVVQAISEETRALIDRTGIGENLISIPALMALQEHFGLEVFETVEAPFMESQYIGHFPEDVRPPEGNYDFIYDAGGPVTYGSPMCREGKHMLGNLAKCLSPDGILYIPRREVGMSSGYFDEDKRTFHILSNQQRARTMGREGSMTIVVNNRTMMPYVASRCLDVEFGKIEPHFVPRFNPFADLLIRWGWDIKTKN